MSLIRNYQGINYVPPLIVKDDKGGGAPSTGGTVSNTPTTPTPAGAQGDYTFSGEDIVSIYNKVLIDIDKTDEVGDTSDDVSAAETEVANAKTAVEDSKTAVSEAETGVSEAQTDVDTAQTAVSKAETNVTTAQTAVDTAQTTVDECSADIATKETAITDAQTAVDNASTAYATAEANFTNAMSNLEALMAQADADPDTDYSAEIAEAEAAVQAAQEQLDQAQAAKEQAEQNLQTAQTALDEAKTKLADAEDALKKAEDELAMAEEALKTAKSDLEKAQSNLEKAKTALEDAKQKQTEAENALKDAEAKLEEAKAKAAEEAKKAEEAEEGEGNTETRGLGVDDVKTEDVIETTDSEKNNITTDDTTENTPVEPIPADDINKAINDNYADLVGTTLDETTMNDIVSMAQAYAQAQGVSSVEDLQKFIDMGVKLAQTAESKEVGKTDYISARIVDFMAMQEANPDMTLDEMNTKLAENYTIESIMANVDTALIAGLGNDVANSGIDYDDLAAYALIEGDNNQLAKLGYYELQSANYLALAQEGGLTNEDYYNCLKMDLLQTFPGYADFTELNIEEIYDKIETLSPEEIQLFQETILSMPSCTSDNYETELTKFLEEFNNATKDKDTYSIENGETVINFEELYQTRYGVEFNADEIIEYKEQEAQTKIALAIEAEKASAHEILESASNDESLSEAIFATLFTLSGSTDDTELTELLQQMSGNSDVKIVDGKVVIESNAPVSRSASSSGETSLEDIKNGMLNTIDSNAEKSIKNLNLKTEKEENGLFGKIGDIFNEACAEYVAPVVEWMNPSDTTLDIIQTVGAVAGVALLGFAFFAGATVIGGVCAIGAGIAGAVSAGSSFVQEVKQLNELSKNGEIQLYDENGNWAPDEKAQEILSNMDKDAALAVVDAFSAGAGTKVAAAAKLGKWGTTALSNGINAVANMIAMSALTGESNVGTNTAMAGIGAMFDIRMSSAKNLKNAGESAVNKIKSFFSENPSKKIEKSKQLAQSMLGKNLTKNKYVDISNISKLQMGQTSLNLENPEFQAYFNSLPDGSVISLGRGSDNTFTFDDPYISRTHLYLKKENGKLYAMDVSTNGTMVTGTKFANYVNPALDKYKVTNTTTVNHQDFIASNPDLFDKTGPWNCWRQYDPQDLHHGAWKMHLYADNEAEWQQLCQAIIPYLKDQDVEFKTFNEFIKDATYLNGDVQQGKAFTIYPKNNAEMAQIAKDLDYIIRNNGLTRPGTSITGDNNLGTTGRLFYRYEFSSGQYKNTILDMSDPAQKDFYHYKLYDANRGEGGYLAKDMTIYDDVWRDFDPSKPNSQPYSSNTNNRYNNRNMYGSGLAIAATVATTLGLTDANAQTVTPPGVTPPSDQPDNNDDGKTPPPNNDDLTPPDNKPIPPNNDPPPPVVPDDPKDITDEDSDGSSDSDSPDASKGGDVNPNNKPDDNGYPNDGSFDPVTGDDSDSGNNGNQEGAPVTGGVGSGSSSVNNSYHSSGAGSSGGSSANSTGQGQGTDGAQGSGQGANGADGAQGSGQGQGAGQGQGTDGAQGSGEGQGAGQGQGTDGAQGSGQGDSTSQDGQGSGQNTVVGSSEHDGGNYSDWLPPEYKDSDFLELNNGKNVDDAVRARLDEAANAARDAKIKELKDLYGDDAIVDVKVDYVIDADGRITFKVDSFVTYGSNSNDLAGSGTSNDPSTLPSNAADDAKFNAALAWVNSTFVDSYGNFDGAAFSNWVNTNYGAEQAFFYRGTDAVYALNMLLQASASGDYSGFWANVGNFGSNGTTGSGSGNSGTAGGSSNTGGYCPDGSWSPTAGSGWGSIGDSFIGVGGHGGSPVLGGGGGWGTSYH